MSLVVALETFALRSLLWGVLGVQIFMIAHPVPLVRCNREAAACRELNVFRGNR